jgi:hypothetical protein
MSDILPTESFLSSSNKSQDQRSIYNQKEKSSSLTTTSTYP